MTMQKLFSPEIMYMPAVTVSIWAEKEMKMERLTGYMMTELQ